MGKYAICSQAQVVCLYEQKGHEQALLDKSNAKCKSVRKTSIALKNQISFSLITRNWLMSKISIIRNRGFLNETQIERIRKNPL